MRQNDISQHSVLMPGFIMRINVRDVIFRFGELIVGKFIDTRRALTNYTCDELYEDGFRLIVDPAPEEEIVEVTMDEIAKLKGVPVERLRVKKEDK